MCNLEQRISTEITRLDLGPVCEDIVFDCCPGVIPWIPPDAVIGATIAPVR